MHIATTMFPRTPIARKLLAIVALFVVIVLCVFYLGVFRSDILSGIRAYVGGEGLWSKGEKRAALSLTKYADGHSDKDYQDYLSEIAVPLGDKQARLQLQSDAPDMALVSQGFVQGRNDLEDVSNMSMLFRRFKHVGYMERAIEIWTEGDRQIDELRALADQLHAEINSPLPDEKKIQQLAEQVVEVDERLTPLEDEFSSTLGQGARWIDRVLSVVALLATGVLLLIGIGFSSVILNELRTSQAKYHKLINTANDAILVVDSESRRILEANNRACTLLGFSAEQLVGMPESRLYPAGTEQSSSAFPARQSAGLASNQEIELLRADGSLVPVEVRSSATEFGGKPAILSMFHDIRDRREAAAVLRRSEDRFSYLIQNLSDVITVVAVDGTMLYQSPSIERVLGYKSSDLLGKSFLAFIHPDDEPAVRAALERVTLGVGSAAPPEFRFRHKDNTWVLARVRWKQLAERRRSRRHCRDFPQCHWTPHARRSGASVTEDGSGRPPRRRHRARLQQPADGDPGICGNRVAGRGRRSGREEERRDHPADDRKRRQSHPAVALLQPKACFQPAGRRP